MTDEIVESAKAVQEVAKTAGQAIETAEKIAGFFSRIMSESIDATFGMLSDTLKFKRWERQIRLIEKVETLIEQKSLSQSIRSIPPKLALPIFQNASLEENESLHDVWAKLLVTALDPSCQEPRTVYIDIIRQLEPIDVKVLNYLYE
ncbi:MAG: Abi-alpha family protein, partial [Thermotogota bacterium]|nr:Abi-alpha family protein [Thermotogota bacterium]